MDTGDVIAKIGQGSDLRNYYVTGRTEPDGELREKFSIRSALLLIDSTQQ